MDEFGQKRWTPQTEKLWEQNLAGSKKVAQEEGGTYRPFKARWQGQELSRDTVVKELARTLEPIGDVDLDTTVHSEMLDCGGLAPNRQESTEGAGGGCYVAIRMRDITTDWSAVQETEIKQPWGGPCQWVQRTMALAMVSGIGTVQLSTALLECPC